MLTNTTIKTAKPKAKPYKLGDSGGLYLQVNTTGSKYWRYRYRFHGKQKLLSIGVYPDVSLAKARDRHRTAREQLADGIDPSMEKQRLKRAATTNSFEAIAREWIGKQAQKWSADHTKRVRTSLEQDVFPDLGDYPIHEIKAPELLATLRKIEARGALETLSKVTQRCGAVFRYGVATGRCERDITADLRGAFATRKSVSHASLSEADLPEFFTRLANYDGDPQTALALEFILLTFVRTAELRGATWDEFDLDNATWRIPAARMKMDEQHIVALSDQALSVLDKLGPGKGLLLPSKKKPSISISENTLLYALYRMGYHGRATVHGLRGTASTILNEQGWRADVIERQLAHGEQDNVRAAYNHAQYLDERRRMMQHWGDYLDGMKRGANVVSINRGA